MEAPFNGKPKLFDGVTNERDLAKICPPQFQRDNPWSDYASRIFFGGVSNISNWKWRDDSKEIQSQKGACFSALLSGSRLKHEDKEAIAGWMLSEMLLEVPAYIAPKKKKGK